MEAKAEELRLLGAEELRVREAAKAVAAKIAEEWAARTQNGKRKGRRERAGKSRKETRLAEDARDDAASKNGNASVDDTSGGDEEEAPLRQDPQQASTGGEGRESEREIGECGDSASDASAFDEKGNAEKKFIWGDERKRARRGRRRSSERGARRRRERRR